MYAVKYFSQEDESRWWVWNYYSTKKAAEKVADLFRVKFKPEHVVVEIEEGRHYPDPCGPMFLHLMPNIN